MAARYNAAIFTLLFCACCLSAQEGSVSFIKAEGALPTPPAALPLPPNNQTQDDDLVLNRKPAITYHFNICILGESEPFYDPDDKHRGARFPLGGHYYVIRNTVCRNYSARKNDEAVQEILLQQAAKSTDFYRVINTYVKAVTEEPDKIAQINIKNAAISAAPARILPGNGTVYKFVITDKKKIKRLYNYTYDEIPLKLDKLMQERGLNNLPIRISVYEDYTPEANNAVAVFAFSGSKRFAVDIWDMNQSGMVYDMKPDYAVKYTANSL